MPSNQKLLPLLAAVLLALSSSCATTALWNGPEADTVDEGGFDFSPEVDGVGDFFAKLALTPFALAFDICTSPIQAWLYEDKSESVYDPFRYS